MANSAPYWADNVSRLAGMHGLNSEQLAQYVGLTPQTISMWRSGKRRPSTDALLAVGRFFEIDALGFATHPFKEHLRAVGDPKRFESVEQKIRGEKALGGVGKVIDHIQAQRAKRDSA